LPTLDAIRERAIRESAALPDRCRAIRDPLPLEALNSTGVQNLAAAADRRITT